MGQRLPYAEVIQRRPPRIEVPLQLLEGRDGESIQITRGVQRLDRAGVPPQHLMVYMLVGFDPTETWQRIFYRFERMAERGMLPYPMVYDPKRKDLKRFQRWVVTGLYRAIPWADYDANARAKLPASGSVQQSLFAGGAG